MKLSSQPVKVFIPAWSGPGLNIGQHLTLSPNRYRGIFKEIYKVWEDMGHGFNLLMPHKPTNMRAIYDLVRGFSRKTVGRTALVMQSSVIVFWEYYRGSWPVSPAPLMSMSHRPWLVVIWDVNLRNWFSFYMTSVCLSYILVFLASHQIDIIVSSSSKIAQCARRLITKQTLTDIKFWI